MEVDDVPRDKIRRGGPLVVSFRFKLESMMERAKRRSEGVAGEKEEMLLLPSWPARDL